jgi:tRNA-splicing ligase RtcB (3'-phosphate/5'-hydroxy nucleic acid ligase)
MTHATSARAMLHKLSETIWEVPTTFKASMQVPARIYATEQLMREMDEAVFDQVTNVATLPGITKYACCMPDGHAGYGFPIGGVAAMDIAAGGVISPGGIGFDINCGMRLVVTNLTYADVQPHLHTLVDRLYERVPAGVGSTGFVKLSKAEFRRVLEEGARWCLRHGYGWEEDLELTEERGCIEGADATTISERAIDRGANQIGTLGSGNHYLEIQVARPEHVYDAELAQAFGITMPNQIVVMFHCGSRGFGHQVATDYLQVFLKVMDRKYGIQILDRELACAPFASPEGQQYFAAMKCGLNMSFANRQVILHRIREVFSQVFGRPAEELGMRMVYDVAHNTAKLERHEVNGTMRTLLVHRKGATRAFAPGMEGLPERYRHTGQPVILGGSMETGSYLLAGVASGSQTFFSTAHGSGRTMSRTKARKQWRGQVLQRDLEARGIYVRSASWSGLAEEAGAAYKSIDEVVAATELAGISKRVAQFVPMGNVKG